MQIKQKIFTATPGSDFRAFFAGICQKIKENAAASDCIFQFIVVRVSNFSFLLAFNTL
jgi:hypothetical protein